MLGVKPMPTFPMEELLQCAPCGLFSYNGDGALVAVNDTVLELLGYTRDELLGRPMTTILTLAGRMFCETHVFPLLRMQGRADELQLPLRSKGGGSIPVLLNAIRKEHEDGVLHHCAFMSVRERGKYEDELLRSKRTAEEALRNNEALNQARQAVEVHARDLDQKISQLEQRNQDLTRVSTALAQDLRQPARQLSMFACLFTREDWEGLSVTGQHSLERIKTVSVKMEQLVMGLHQFMALDVLDEPIEDVDLLESLGSARHRVVEMGGSPSLALRCEPLPVIQGRRRQLMLLFFHLLDNAAKFRKPRGEARLDIGCQLIEHNSFRSIKDKYHYTDFVRITFTDNGIGFDPLHRSHVFEVLRKLNPDTPGIGVGLAICRKVVENHHGSISVESEPGRGTQFTILLPVKQQTRSPGE
ncbi:signal transduction histidine kinase [Cystobacter fuscus]|uniref:histidine kinase n=1 Tax=Cystobacter fuscus TaxID=43 RepID=A0A250IZI5_9BACT|nr:ATP-binding protein [Cystobacter fuscus]ATB37134.1 signal transduction histidine kinase [Cystobacter fuscus]